MRIIKDQEASSLNGAANDNKSEQNSNKICLCCDRLFVSQGKYHRVCDACKAGDGWDVPGEFGLVGLDDAGLEGE